MDPLERCARIPVDLTMSGGSEAMKMFHVSIWCAAFAACAACAAYAICNLLLILQSLPPRTVLKNSPTQSKFLRKITKSRFKMYLGSDLYFPELRYSIF